MLLLPPVVAFTGRFCPWHNVHHIHLPVKDKGSLSVVDQTLQDARSDASTKQQLCQLSGVTELQTEYTELQTEYMELQTEYMD